MREGRKDALGKSVNRACEEVKERCIRKAYEQGRMRKVRKDALGKLMNRGV